MEKAAYEELTAQLVDTLGDRAEVLGLVAVGSMASGPDTWSDHDFLVVTDPAATEGLREDPTWLPDHERLVLHFRETAHGVKALYDDAHLLEYAVFTPDEHGLALLNPACLSTGPTSPMRRFALRPLPGAAGPARRG